MIVLDTNVLSEMMRSRPDPRVIGWLNRQALERLWITSVTVFESRFGIERMAAGRRKSEIDAQYHGVVAEDLRGRVLDLDERAAELAASIGARLQSAGRPIQVNDLLIAGMVSARDATLATRNVRHFDDTGIRTVDPWEG
ncbi:type II toxin-antitoxin system VapC family toxin [Mucisphaera calidilacus]|uniref:Ribonuclease VapC n=1 Tax=Mucisphaera calidilacus TaxID=2527982 RepID=A0A518C1B5_9BACT|nr:type II toxin-antitoxin system VapC family toxin [Mucisphaera calidilacus]QDU73017.1 Toxin FitB [Mucisphaera calidilacus]